MSRKRTRRVHSVKAELQVKALTRAGSSLKLVVYAQKLKIGELEIGQGGLYWWGRSRRSYKRLSWTKFAAVMDEIAYEA